MRTSSRGAGRRKLYTECQIVKRHPTSLDARRARLAAGVPAPRAPRSRGSRSSCSRRAASRRRRSTTSPPRSGVSRRTLFRYFASKNDIVWGEFDERDGRAARTARAPRRRRAADDGAAARDRRLQPLSGRRSCPTLRIRMRLIGTVAGAPGPLDAALRGVAAIVVGVRRRAPRRAARRPRSRGSSAAPRSARRWPPSSRGSEQGDGDPADTVDRALAHLAAGFGLADRVSVAGAAARLPARLRHRRRGSSADGSLLIGGEPFAIVRLARGGRRRGGRLASRAHRSERMLAQPGGSRAPWWRANLALPVPPAGGSRRGVRGGAGPRPPRAARAPARGAGRRRRRSARSSSSTTARPTRGAIRRVTERCGAELVRRERAGGPAPRATPASPAPTAPLVAFVDSDCVPRPGWLAAAAPALRGPGCRARRAARRPAQRAGRQRGRALRGGPLGARPRPASGARCRPAAGCRSCPARRWSRGARRSAPASTTRLAGGEDVELVWRLAGRRRGVATSLRAWSSTTSARTLRRLAPAPRWPTAASAAPLARRHPACARPLGVSPWTAAAWAAAGLRRPARGGGDHRRSPARCSPATCSASEIAGGGGRCGRRRRSRAAARLRVRSRRSPTRSRGRGRRVLLAGALVRYRACPAAARRSGARSRRCSTAGAPGSAWTRCAGSRSASPTTSPTDAAVWVGCLRENAPGTRCVPTSAGGSPS